MGFIRNKLELEKYLVHLSTEWRMIDDSEYRGLVKSWKTAFEDKLKAGDIRLEGDKAISKFRERLPAEIFLINLPGYKYLPVAPSASEPTYGYFIKEFNIIDREVLNRVEAIATDSNVSFTCIFNHEWQAACPEIFLES